MKGMRDESMNLIHGDLFYVDDGYQDKIHDHALIERDLSDIVHDDHYMEDLVDMVQKFEIGPNNRLLDSVEMGSENRLLLNIGESNIDSELDTVDEKNCAFLHEVSSTGSEGMESFVLPDLDKSISENDHLLKNRLDEKKDFYGKRQVHVAYHENYGQDLIDIAYPKTAPVLAGEKHKDIPCEVIELVDDLVNDVDKVLGECSELLDVHSKGSSIDEDFIFGEHNDIMEDFVGEACRIPLFSKENKMEVVDIPVERGGLNVFETYLIKIGRTFQTIIKLQPLCSKTSGKCHGDRYVDALKGLAVHLRSSLKSTHNYLQQELPCIESLDILVDSYPTKKQVVWCSIFDMKEVYNALKKLREINPLSGKIGIKTDLNFLCEKDIPIDVVGDQTANVNLELWEFLSMLRKSVECEPYVNITIESITGSDIDQNLSIKKENIYATDKCPALELKKIKKVTEKSKKASDTGGFEDCLIVGLESRII
uniref:Uncharacterized protein n=1 Tax=Romanomermis culicivorax TaxID=13658 RepID=A0A915IMV0_ROMCU